MKLPPGVRARPRVNGPTRYEIRFTDQRGLPQSELHDSPAQAVSERRKRVAEVRAGTYVPPGSKTHTVAAYSGHYFAVRDRRRSIETDVKRFELHIAPHLGDRKLGDLEPKDVAEWIAKLKAAREISAKTICNVHGVLHAMYERAVFEGLVLRNPAKLPKGMLPKVKRGGPRFERVELAMLCTDDRIDLHRRVFYALQVFTGMRKGEASGRRVRDIDRDAPILAALTIDSQYEDRPLKMARDEDPAARVAPMHSELRRAIDEWLACGFRETYGRDPLPSDWLVPDPKTGLPRTANQATKALYRDCALLGIPRRGTHAFRRACISLARGDGARADVFERITHNASGDMIDVYTSFEWAALCEAASALRLSLSGPASGSKPVHHSEMGMGAWRRRESNRAPDATFDGVSTGFARSDVIGAVAESPEKPRGAPTVWAQAQQMVTVLEAALTSRLRGTHRHSHDIGHLVAPLAGRRNNGADRFAMQPVTHVTNASQDCLPFAGWHPSWDAIDLARGGES